MNKKERYKIIIIIILVISSFLLLLNQKTTPKEISYLSKQETIPKNYRIPIKTENNTLNKAILEINNVAYESEIKKEISVYNFMSKLKDEGKINFKEKTYPGMGKFIEEINGIKPNNEKYWIYYVNNKKANIGISDYKIKPGDVVSWKLEKI